MERTYLAKLHEYTEFNAVSITGRGGKWKLFVCASHGDKAIVIRDNSLMACVHALVDKNYKEIAGVFCGGKGWD